MSQVKHIPQSQKHLDSVLIQDVSQRRETIKLRPLQGGTFTQNTRIQFRLPNTHFHNLYNARLRTNITVASGTAPALREGAWTCINRIVFRAGSRILLEINEYGSLMMALWKIKSSSTIQTGQHPSLAYGVDDLASRVTNASGRDYEFPLFQPFFKRHDWLPTSMIADNFEIDIYIERDVVCCQNTAGVSTVSLANVELSLDSMIPTPTFAALVQGKIMSNSYVMQLGDYRWYQDNLAGTSNIVRITDTSVSINSYLAVLRTAADLIDQTDTDGIVQSEYLAMTNLQFRINGQLYPQESIDHSTPGVESFQKLMEASHGPDFDIYRDISSITDATYITNRHYIWVALSHLHSARERDGIVHGLNFSRNNGTFEVLFTHGGVLSGVQIDQWLSADRFWHIDSNSRIKTSN